MSKRTKTLNTQERIQLLAEARRTGRTESQAQKQTRNYTMVVVMLEAGLRVGELIQLRIKDCIFNTEPVKSIIVRAEIAKNHIERIIPVSELLREAFVLQDESIWKRDSQAGSARYAFEGQCLKALTARQVQRIVAGLSLSAIGRRIHPHVLRHTFATRLMKVTDMRTVQELLGHKNITSTQIYTHPDGDDMKQAIDNMHEHSDNPNGMRLFTPERNG